MRQKLPETAGYPLMVNDIGRTVHPGETFDCPLLVPGCVPVDENGEEIKPGPEEGAESGGDGDGKPAAKGRADGKGARL